MLLDRNLVSIKVADHSFQVPKPNSYAFALYFERVNKVNDRRVYSRSLAKVCAVALTTRLVRNKA